LRVTEDADKVVFRGNVFEVSFDKKTGLLDKVLAGGAVVIENGPFLNLDVHKTPISADGAWRKKNFCVGMERRCRGSQTRRREWKSWGENKNKHFPVGEGCV
jgi:hypothetical protein